MEDRVGYFRKLFVENVVGTFINLQLGDRKSGLQEMTGAGKEATGSR